jgi:hypothetical protein
MTEQICAEFAARYVGAKREHRNARSRAGSNRKCERIEEFRFEIVKSRVAWRLRFVFLTSHAFTRIIFVQNAPAMATTTMPPAT